MTTFFFVCVAITAGAAAAVFKVQRDDLKRTVGLWKEAHRELGRKLDKLKLERDAEREAERDARKGQKATLGRSHPHNISDKRLDLADCISLKKIKTNFRDKAPVPLPITLYLTEDDIIARVLAHIGDQYQITGEEVNALWSWGWNDDQTKQAVAVRIVRRFPEDNTKIPVPDTD